jgi:hypothetical protein
MKFDSKKKGGMKQTPKKARIRIHLVRPCLDNLLDEARISGNLDSVYGAFSNVFDKSFTNLVSFVHI